MNTSKMLVKCTGNEQGITVVFVAIAIFIILAFVGIAVDLGYMYVAKGQLQNASDAGALAGAGSLYPSNSSPPGSFPSSPNWTSAQSNATAFVKQNKAAGANLTDADIESVQAGYWDLKKKDAADCMKAGDCSGHTPQGICSSDNNPCTSDSGCVQTITAQTCLIQEVPAVQVNLVKSGVHSFFARVLGWTEFSTKASAVAVSGFPDAIPPGGLFPVALSRCMTESYFFNPDGSPKTLPTPPETIEIFSPYNQVANCNTGQWTSFKTGDNNVPTIRNFIFNGNDTPLDVGDPIWIEPGVKATIYDSIQEYLDAGRDPNVLLPVVQNVDDSTHSWTPILGFVGFHIDGQVKHGNKSYIIGHFIAYYKSNPGTKPGGSKINAVIPAVLVK